jgi:2-oxoglutarate ferredoxin oxidoreductase subunit beta
MVTGTTPEGNSMEPERPLALAVAGDCAFAARGFVGEMDHLVDLIQKAIRHEGFSFVEILQPCVSFNKVNTFDWYKKRVYVLDDASYDPTDRPAAFRKALEWGDRIPLGVIFRAERRTYEDLRGLKGSEPLKDRALDKGKLADLFKEFR